ncbi:MAG: hypothetical protein JWP40_986 [Blastococcus sp.]|nr:hypothetical protein [Blastococcus sp.]
MARLVPPPGAGEAILPHAAAITTDPDEALVRRHGKEGALYLEHLRESSTNPFLQRVIADLEQEAEAAGDTGLSRKSR